MQIKELCFALALLGAAHIASADDLADGMKAWENQDFGRAHQLLGKLAQAGNAEAQVMLGEMYGFGEGVPEDPVQAENWLNKAKAAGNKQAANSLAVLQQRQLRKQDIEFYRSAYTGDEFAYAKQGCNAPDFPNISQDQDQVQDIKGKMADWSECFKRFGKKLADALPAGKLIPAEVSALMSSAEMAQARSTMDKAYARMIKEGEQSKRQVIAAYDAWVDRTETWAEAIRQKDMASMDRLGRKAERSAERVRSAARTPEVSSGGKR